MMDFGSEATKIHRILVRKSAPLRAGRGGRPVVPPAFARHPMGKRCDGPRSSR